MWLALFVGACFLVILQGSLGLVVQPAETTIEEYASLQETVVTIINDGFSPRGCDMAFDERSAYLEPYVHIEPSQFVIQPQEELNVQVTTQFPSGFAPQLHRLRIVPCQGEELVDLLFRPSGTRQQALVVEGLDGELSDDQFTLTMTVNLKNTGNVYVFATPELVIDKEGDQVRNITYPQPIVIAPGELYPLTLRHDTSELSPGSYSASVRVAYATEEETLYTDRYATPFRIDEREEAIVQDRNWTGLALALSVVIVLVGAWSLLGRKKREKHIRRKEAVPARDPRAEVRALRRELDGLAKEVRVFVEEAESWLEKGRVS